MLFFLFIKYPLMNDINYYMSYIFDISDRFCDNFFNRRYPMTKNLRMKAAGAAKDMSQKDVAEAIGITRQTMNAIENGEYNPSLKLCIAVCKVLDKTLDELFWE